MLGVWGAIAQQKQVVQKTNHINLLRIVIACKDFLTFCGI